MTKQIIRTVKAPAPPPSYSQGVVAAGLIFVAGQGPFDPTSGEVVGSTIQEQTAQCLRNLAAIFEAERSSMAKVVSATFILADEADFSASTKSGASGFRASRQPVRVPSYPSAPGA